MRSSMSYNSEPRNFSLGFGRGNPRPYQTSQPTPSPQSQQMGDPFVEAGRLAVEYLVSRGLLSSNVLPGKSQDHRTSQDREIFSGRKSPNDEDMDNSRSYSRERRKYGDSRGNNIDYSRENGMVGSLNEKTSFPQAMEVDDGKSLKDKEENSDVRISRSTEPGNNDVHHSDAQDETEMRGPLVKSDSKVTFSLQGKDDKELPKSVDEAKEELKDGIWNNDQEQKMHTVESPVQHSKNSNDVSAKEEKNATEIHCFMNDKSLKNESFLVSQGMNVSNAGLNFHESGKDNNMSGPPAITSSSGISSSNFPDQLEPAESLSFADKGFSREQESSGIPELNMSSSAKQDGNEKRAHEEDCTTEGTKKAKQWLSVAQSNEFFQFSDQSEKKPISLKIGDANIFQESSGQGNFHNASLPLQGGVESSMDRKEEKDLFSSSYKIFDLNLMETSDIHENHGVSALLYPSLPVPKKEPQIDIDLSMSNNCSFMSEYNPSGSVRKDVEIIDLESSSVEEGNSSKFSTKSADPGITSTENFADGPQQTNDNPDGQDGYGFMINELLGNDVPNCSTVQPDVNSLQDQMGLRHGEGIFTEDDPIYMSLGEIPLSLLQAWEQPNQEKNPFDL